MPEGLDPRRSNGQRREDVSTTSDGSPSRSGQQFRAVPVLWQRAPFVLRRHPVVAVSVLCAAFVVAIAAASAPLLRAAATSGALKGKLQSLTPLAAGLEVRQPSGSELLVAQSVEAFAATDQARRAAAQRLAESLPWVGSAVVTTLGHAQVAQEQGLDGNPLELIPMARTGARANVVKLAGKGPGVWVADTTAAIARLQPGDELALEGLNFSRGRPETTHVRVSAVYRNLIRNLDNPYWTNYTHDIRTTNPNGPDPPAFVLMSPSELYRVVAAVGANSFRNVYEIPVDPRKMTLSRARRLDARLNEVRHEIERGGPLARQLGCGNGRQRCDVTSSLQAALSLAEQDVASLIPTLTVFTSFVALLALAAAAATGVFNVHRRRQEVTLFYARGESRTVFATRTALEALLATLVGAAGGLVCALLLLTVLAPTGTIDSEVVYTAAVAVAVGAVGTLLAIAIGSATVFAPDSSRRVRGRRSIPWDVAATVGAIAGFFALERVDAFGGDPHLGQHPQVVVLLLPIVAAAGVTGLAVRIFRRTLRRARPRRQSILLVVRRIAAARGLLILLTVLTAVAVAALTSAQTLSASLDASTAQKAYVSNGADVAGVIDPVQPLPRRFPYPLAKVEQTFNRVRLDAASGASADLLAADPSALARVVAWRWPGDPRPALRKLARAPARPLPIVAVNGAEGVTSIWIDGKRVPVHVVEGVSAFPGEAPGRPLVVVPRAALREALRRVGLDDLSPNIAFVWGRGDPVLVKRALARSLLAPAFLSTAQELRNRSDVQTITRTYGFLRVIAVGSGAFVLVALLLYLHARQRSGLLAHALLRRMGMSTRALTAANALEAVGLVVFAVFFGDAAGLISARALIAHLDPLPQLPPSPTLVVPTLQIAAALVGAACAAALIAIAAGVYTARSDVSGVLRAE
jgi:hypothetical protein